MKKNDSRLTVWEILILIAWFLIIGIAIGFFILYFYTLFRYSGTPISEVPGWAYWLVFKNR